MKLLTAILFLVLSVSCKSKKEREFEAFEKAGIPDYYIQPLAEEELRRNSLKMDLNNISCESPVFKNEKIGTSAQVKSNWDHHRVTLLAFIDASNGIGNTIGKFVLYNKKKEATDTLKAFIKEIDKERDLFDYLTIPAQNRKLNVLIYKYYCQSKTTYSALLKFMLNKENISIDEMQEYMDKYIPDDSKKMAEINQEFKRLQELYKIKI